MAVSDEAYNKVLDGSGQMSILSIRLKGSVTTLVSLFPIILALMPGFSMGAKMVKKVIPQSAIATYVIAMAPVFQVPLLVCILGIFVQVGYAPEPQAAARIDRPLTANRPPTGCSSEELGISFSVLTKQNHSLSHASTTR